MRPVTIAVTGGLGNQLFQFAAALAVAEASGREVRLCYRMFDRPAARRAFLAARRWMRGLWRDADGRYRLDAMVRRPELLQVQDLARETSREEDRRDGLDRARLKRAFKDPESRIQGCAVLRTSADVRHAAADPGSIDGGLVPLIAGFVQGDEFVAPRLEVLRGSIRLPTDSPYVRRWTARARSRPTVGVHVRRGDYTKKAFEGMFPLLQPEWYVHAAAAVRERHGDVGFLVVTDDPAWARANLRLPGPVEIASGEHPASPQEDLAVFAACAHHVVANSTFSWWGARLSRSGGTVVAPTRWFMERELEPGFLPSSWIALPNAALRG